MRGIGGWAATLLLLTTAACGGSGDGTSGSERSAISVESSPKTAGYATSAHGDTVAFASPAVWDRTSTRAGSACTWPGTPRSPCSPTFR